LEVTVIDSDTAPDDLFPSTVLVTRALAEKVWPGASTFVGKTLYFGTGETANGARVVGVLEHLQSQGAQVSERGDYSTIVPVRLANGTAPCTRCASKRASASASSGTPRRRCARPPLYRSSSR
jgi:putative ABC transport system permease protein